VLVIDGDGRLVHAPHVHDQKDQPDYDAAVAAAAATG
jgi:hypothetical protein